MRWILKEWNTTTGALKRTLSSPKSVHYKAQCNDEGDLRYGAILNEVLTASFFTSSEEKLSEGAWISLEARNNPIMGPAQVAAGYTDTQYTFYGIYKVDEVTDGKGFYTVTAYSSTHDLNVDYSARLKYLNDTGAFPMTAYSLVQDVCNFLGLSFSRRGAYNALASTTITGFYSNGITAADILRAAAEIDGAFVADAAGRTNTSPTAPISTQRGIVFKSYSLRTNYNNQSGTYDYYLIAPGRSAVDHSVFDSSQTFFANVYYKQDGLKAAGAVNAVTSIEATNAQGTTTKTGQTSPAVPNPYVITSNILADNYSTFLDLNNIWTYIRHAQGSPILHPATVRLFPFYCPFRCGDIANVTDGNGVSFQMPIMQFEIDDAEAVLTCTGNEFYGTAQNQYASPTEVSTQNAVNIEKLRDSKVDISALANGSVKFMTFNIAARGTVELTLPNSSHHIIFGSGAGTAKFMAIINTTSTGGVTVSTVYGSSLTTATSTNSLTLTNGASSTCFAVALSYSGGLPVVV